MLHTEVYDYRIKKGGAAGWEYFKAYQDSDAKDYAKIQNATMLEGYDRDFKFWDKIDF